MKYLGIDYGTKRIGVAVSDPQGRVAFPLRTVTAGPTALTELCTLITENEAEKIVLGESRDYKGAANPVMEDIEAFKKDLEELAGIPVAYEPEFMTSAQAAREGESKELDASAAALILQSFLDKMNR